ncbi:hypothetical protein B0H11DRAFT_2227185 [Mycena galericulata]|nr:hypothetical protein B0H11DRAFT_2227185 [Mycena galericulata]
MCRIRLLPKFSSDLDAHLHRSFQLSFLATAMAIGTGGVPRGSAEPEPPLPLPVSSCSVELPSKAPEWLRHVLCAWHSGAAHPGAALRDLHLCDSQIIALSGTLPAHQLQGVHVDSSYENASAHFARVLTICGERGIEYNSLYGRFRTCS